MVPMGGPGDDITMHTGPRGYVEPTFGQRLLARLVDALALVLLLSPLLLLPDGRSRIALALAVGATYETVMVARWGRTLGKVALGTWVMDAAYASTPTTKQSALRWFGLHGGGLAALLHPAWAGFGSLWLAVAVLPVMVPPLHRGLHDRAAGTIVSADSRPIVSC